MPPDKIDSLADDVKPLVLGLLRRNSELTSRVEELVTQNKALLARIAELEALHGKPPKTPDNSSLPPSRGQKGNVAEQTRVKKARKGRPGAARALAENPDGTRDIYAEEAAPHQPAAPGEPPGGDAAEQGVPSPVPRETPHELWGRWGSTISTSGLRR